MKKHSQNERVYFSLGENAPSGWGKVCGQVGPVIIIELESPIQGYEFTHTYILDQQIVEPPVSA